MKTLPILLILVSFSSYAEEECIFNETVYMEFIENYSAENSNTKIEPDGRTLTVTRDNEEIIVKGGGCVHMGVAVELRGKQAYSDDDFLRKTHDLAKEFGSWLINVEALKDAIEKSNYRIIDGTYYFEVDALTVFSASHDGQGIMNVDFYIN